MSNRVLEVTNGEFEPYIDLEGIYAQATMLPDRDARMSLTATLLVRAGFAVVPLEMKGYKFRNGNVASGKQLHHAFKDYNQAMVSEDTATKYWGRGGKYEGCGVGIACGPAKSPNNCLSVFAIDLDIAKGERSCGVDSILRLESDLGALPMDGPVITTPSGGRHILFRWVDGLTNTAGALGEGVDSRGGSLDGEGIWGRGGHIVFDPDLGYEPIHGGILKPLPASWLAAFIQSVTKRPAYLPGKNRGQITDLDDLDVKEFVKNVGVIPQGQRNIVLFKLGLSTMARTGDLEFVTQVVREAALKCEGDFSSDEVEYLIGRIDKSRVAKTSREKAEVQGQWQVTEKGKPRQNNEFNANLVIGSGVFSRKWRIAFDEFYWSTTVNGQEISDTIETEIRMWMTGKFRIDFLKMHVRDALSRVAVRNKTHAFREWLERLPLWDGEDRFPELELLLHDQDDLPSDSERELNADVLRKTLISAVHRAHDVWEKVRHITILVGPQNSGKSDLWKFLCPVLNSRRTYTDSVTFKSLGKGADGQRDMLKQMAGCVFAEFAEMAGLTKQREEEVKHFISGHAGKFVNKYEKYAAEEPPHSVPVGTLNPGGVGFLKDATGLTRWHPLACTAETVNTDWISQNSEHLWAQALYRYRQGEKHWFEKHEPKYHRLQERAAMFHAVWGGTKELAEIIEQGEGPFDQWFVSRDELKVACEGFLVSQQLEELPRREEQGIAMKKAGFVPTQDLSYNRAWKFKVTEQDLAEFGAHILGRARRVGSVVSVDSGWVSPQAWSEFAPLTNSNKARLWVRKANQDPGTCDDPATKVEF